MKRNYFKITVLVCILAAGMTGCNFSTKQKADNVENAENQVIDAKADLQKARVDSTNEYERYKAESDAKLKANEVKIAALKEKVTAQNQQLRADYQKKLNVLEKKNAQLRADIVDYQGSDRDKWEKFKTKFNQDLYNLGQSISSLADKGKF